MLEERLRVRLEELGLIPPEVGPDRADATEELAAWASVLHRQVLGSSADPSDPEAMRRAFWQALARRVVARVERQALSPWRGLRGGELPRVPGSIFLWAAPVDQQAGAVFAEQLRDGGLRAVLGVDPTGSETDVLRAHRGAMMAADVLVVFWGQASRSWVLHALAHARGARAWRHGRAFEASFVAASEMEGSADKKFFYAPGWRVVPSYAAEILDGLEPPCPV